MQVPEYRVIGIPGLPEIRPESGLGELICRAVRAASLEVRDGDIFVVTHKVVSKEEGRTVRLESVKPSRLARTWAGELSKDPALVEIILSQSRRIVRMDRGRLIVETHHGFVCANAGVDQSNCAAGEVTLLPEDPDASARRLRSCLERSFRTRLAVIVSDTFGRPWREGLVNVAIGVAGLMPLDGLPGRPRQRRSPAGGHRHGLGRRVGGGSRAGHGEDPRHSGGHHPRIDVCGGRRLGSFTDSGAGE